MNEVLPYPVGLAVIVTKLSACKIPVTEPSSWDDWNYTGNNSLSLPVDYEMQGYLLYPVKIGGRIHLYRTQRNGFDSQGYFYSSPICSIRDDALVETFNSIYRVVQIDVLEKKVQEL